MSRIAMIAIPIAALGIFVLRTSPPMAAAEKPADDGFVSIFDGKSLDGWKISAKTGHSGTTKNKSGGRWVVEEGAIVGSQDVPGNGGIMITEKEFGDFEVTLEMNNDFGPDSGLFLRSTDTGKCYQAMIDYHADGNLMGVYGEGIGGKPNVLSNALWHWKAITRSRIFVTRRIFCCRTLASMKRLAKCCRRCSWSRCRS